VDPTLGARRDGSFNAAVRPASEKADVSSDNLSSDNVSSTTCTAGTSIRIGRANPAVQRATGSAAQPPTSRGIPRCTGIALLGFGATVRCAPWARIHAASRSTVHPAGRATVHPSGRATVHSARPSGCTVRPAAAGRRSGPAVFGPAEFRPSEFRPSEFRPVVPEPRSTSRGRSEKAPLDPPGERSPCFGLCGDCVLQRQQGGA
jgi:hypothetical protein